MKLDKIKFAQLINHICEATRNSLSVNDIQTIDSIIDIDLPPPEKIYGSTADVNEMLRAIANGEKIAAIKAHRTLTGFGLKESKDMIELVTSKMP